jgi:VanZ family protein
MPTHPVAKETHDPGRRRERTLLRYWSPVVLWAGIIFSMSTDTFSSEHTGGVLEPVLRWLVPSLAEEQFFSIHSFLRKSAHFSEYFVFALFLYRAVRGDRKGWRWTWGLAAALGAASYSVLDELHQMFVASRTASAYDSLLDTTGALMAVAVLRVWFRLRETRATGVESAS